MHELENLDRRSWLQTMALLLGAATVPTLAGCKAAMDGKGALAGDQLKLLEAIADTMIPANDTPGALAGNVPKNLNGLLANWAAPKTRTELIGAIDAIGKLGGDKGFVAADAAGRKTALAAYDADAVKPGPPSKEKLSGLAALMGGGGPPPMNPAYVRLKGLIINLYYNSEPAMTKEQIYEHVPGKWVPSMKATPETRPFAGVGGLG